jgi:hypothetical protein
MPGCGIPGAMAAPASKRTTPTSAPWRSVAEESVYFFCTSTCTKETPPSVLFALTIRRFCVARSMTKAMGSPLISAIPVKAKRWAKPADSTGGATDSSWKGERCHKGS